MSNTKLSTSTPQSKKKSGTGRNTVGIQPSTTTDHPFSTKRDSEKSKSGTDKQAGGRKGHQ